MVFKMLKNISVDLTMEILKPYGMVFDFVEVFGQSLKSIFHLNDYGHTVSVGLCVRPGRSVKRRCDYECHFLARVHTSFEQKFFAVAPLANIQSLEE